MSAPENESEKPPTKGEEFLRSINPTNWSLPVKVGITAFAIFLGSIGYFRGNFLPQKTSPTEIEDNESEDVALGLAEDRGKPIAAEFSDTAGQKVELEQLRGKVNLVTFWASWCEPCLLELPTFKSLFDKIANPDFRIIAVNLDEDTEGKKSAKELWGKLQFAFPFFLDPAKAGLQAFQVETIPATFILDKQGRIAMSTTGSNDWSNERIVDSIVELLKNK